MSLKIGDNFNYLGKKPLDNRQVIDTLANLKAVVENTIYDGIMVYVTSEQKFYVYDSSNTIDTTTGKWREFSGNDSSDTNCVDYLQDTQYTTKQIIRYKDKLYIATTDYTSDNTQATVDLSFNEDLKNNKLISVITDKKISKVLQYSQGTQYDKDVLVYVGDKMARVDVDYTADTTQANDSDSFDLDVTNGNLIPVSMEDIGSVLPYAQDTDYIANTLVFNDDKIARVLSNYHSDNTPGNTLKLSFEDDIKSGKLSLINTDHITILNKYAQSNMYFVDTLVYHDKYIARVLKDFVANSTEATEAESFEADITLGNIMVVNKEAEPGIKPYKQNTFFSKDKLVFADGRIGRVLNDYISDNTGATLEESINKDIANGNLKEMADNYKFKLYRTTQDMNKTIDAINTLPASTIQFENGETVQNMRVNEGIYGPLGTLSIITEIDINTNTIKCRTVNSREMEFMPPAPNTYNYEIVLAGTGYTTGEILPTNLPNVNVEVQSVGSNGDITSVIATNQTITNANGVGASITADIEYYVGNGKQWYSIPEPETGATLEEYEQGKSYTKDSLIFIDNILARALVDFTADSTLTTVTDSFKFDLDNNNLIRMTREDVSVPECLGSVKTDNASDLPALPMKGNWVLIENCVNTAPNQAGIGLYNGTSWDISPIPQGKFNFPEPSDDGKPYLRKRDMGNTSGQWEALTKIDGNDIEMVVKTRNDITNNTYVPANRELVWDTNRQILVIGDGVTTLGNLKAFYGKGVTSTDILTALGYTPEDIANKGQANGYAPLDANGKVPASNLPDAVTNTYSKTEIDNKDTSTLNAATALVNTEATTARSAEAGLRTDLDNHINDSARHVTQSEKDGWDAKVDASDLTNYDNHLSDTVIHVTQADKDKWNGMTAAFYVTNVSDLPTTGNQIGNMGYVQVSAAGVTPVVCDQYIWTGTKWEQLDANQVSLSFTWGNINGKPTSTPLSIDNAVTVAHNHNNETVLNKIGQSATGNFTYDGVEIGVRAIFLDNENMLPTTGETDTLYVVYEDSRVRNYPSISVWRDNSYQILGRGTQDAPAVVGDMSILQVEYFSVVPGSSHKISTTSNQYFAFMPVEILREIEGLKNQSKVITDLDDSSKYKYNEQIFDINSTNKLSINLKEYQCTLDTVSDYFYSSADVDLSVYKDIDSIE